MSAEDPNRRYALAALDSACANVAHAPSGDRHNVLAKEAFALSRFIGKGLEPQTVYDSLMQASATCGLPTREADRVLRDSFGSRIAGKQQNRESRVLHSALNRNFQKEDKAVKPEEAEEAVRSNAKCAEWLATGYTAAELWEYSPVPLANADCIETTEMFFRALYRPGEFINVMSGAKQNDDGKWVPSGYGVTKTREEWIDVLRTRKGLPRLNTEAGAWVRMNPTDGKGIAATNIIGCRYLLIESDTLPMELQLALIANLHSVAMVVSSGARSLHAWLYLDDNDVRPTQARLFSKELLSKLKPLGVDAGGNFTPERLSRLPGVKRGPERQTLLWLNPVHEERTILERMP